MSRLVFAAAFCLVAAIIVSAGGNNKFCDSVESMLTVQSQPSSQVQTPAPTAAPTAAPTPVPTAAPTTAPSNNDTSAAPAASTTTTTTTTNLPPTVDEEEQQQQQIMSVAGAVAVDDDGDNSGVRRRRRIASELDAAAAANSVVRVGLTPLLFSAISQGKEVALRDIVARAQNNQQFGAHLSNIGTLGGVSISTTYKFFTTVAAVARTKDAGSWGQSVWDTLGVTNFPGAKSNKPWLVDVESVRRNLTAAPFNMPSVATATGASIDDVRSKLAMGYLVAVLYQSLDRHYARCSTDEPSWSGIPWALEQSRSMLGIVAAVDGGSIYIIDSCSHEAVKIALDEFMLRWHACEINNGASVPQCTTGGVLYISINAQAPGSSSSSSDSSSSTPASSDARTLTNDVQGVTDLRSARQG